MADFRRRRFSEGVLYGGASRRPGAQGRAFDTRCHAQPAFRLSPQQWAFSCGGTEPCGKQQRNQHTAVWAQGRVSLDALLTRAASLGYTQVEVQLEPALCKSAVDAVGVPCVSIKDPATRAFLNPANAVHTRRELVPTTPWSAAGEEGTKGPYVMTDASVDGAVVNRMLRSLLLRERRQWQHDQAQNLQESCKNAEEHPTFVRLNSQRP